MITLGVWIFAAACVNSKVAHPVTCLIAMFVAEAASNYIRQQ